MGLKEQIFTSDDCVSETITVPEWGVTLEIRSMTAGHREELSEAYTEAAEAKKRGISVSPHFLGAVVAACTFDPETGDKVFSPSDVPALMQKSGAAVNKVADVGMRLSGMTAEASEEAGKG